MAVHYVVRCADCEVDGPFIRRVGNDAAVLATLLPGDGRLALRRSAEPSWCEFLDGHEYHDLRLIWR